MNKKALYNAIMEKVAVQVKKAINESDNNNFKNFMSDDEVMNLIDPKLIITDNGITYINLEDLNILPDEIIKEIVLEIIQNGEMEDWGDGYTTTIGYYIEQNDNAPILLRSAEYYRITVSYDVKFDISTVYYYEGSTPPGGPDPSEIKTSDDIEVYNVKLVDENSTYIVIEDEEIINEITDQLYGSEIEQDRIDEYIWQQY